jgi:hypothetical protein
MPKLQRIDGKVKHYAYTPEGKKQYLQDKANLEGMKKMQPPMHKMPNGKMMAGKKHKKKYTSGRPAGWFGGGREGRMPSLSVRPAGVR